MGAEGDFDDNWTWDTYYQIAYNSRHQFLLRQPINANFKRALNAVIESREQPADLCGSAEHQPTVKTPLRVACRSIRSG